MVYVLGPVGYETEEDALVPVVPDQEEVLHYLECLFQAHLDSEEEVLDFLFLVALCQVDLCQVVLYQEELVHLEILVVLL